MAANTIFFGTNRNHDAATRFTFGNSYSPDKPYYYRVGEVEVERVGHPWRDVDAAYRCGTPKLYDEEPADPATGKPPVLGSAQLFDRLRGTMLEDPRDVIVHLHGFACDFGMAMERAAEIRDAYLSRPTDPETRDLAGKEKEPLVFSFSWPSDGVTLGDAAGADPEKRKWAYSSDREDARASGQAVARCAMRMLDYLARLDRDERCGQRLHLVAHSMGNWTLKNAVQALQQIAAEGGERLRMVFDNAFLMCADIEDDALEHEHALAPLLRLARNVHVYHAANDSALSLSEIKPNQGARLGHTGPANMNVLPDRVFAIDCASVSFTPDLGHARHQYYRLAPEVTKDVRAVLAGKTPAEMPWRVREGGNRHRIKLDHPAREKLRGKERPKPSRRRSGTDR